MQQIITNKKKNIKNYPEFNVLVIKRPIKIISVFIVDLSIVDCYNIPVFAVELPPNLNSLYIENCDLKIFKSELPETLESLRIFDTDLSIFNSILPNKLGCLVIKENKLILFDSLLPIKLNTFYISCNNIKKLKLNKMIRSYEYDDIKNKKTFHKRKFYKK
jgi:hypothetical protein